MHNYAYKLAFTSWAIVLGAIEYGQTASPLHTIYLFLCSTRLVLSLSHTHTHTQTEGQYINFNKQKNITSSRMKTSTSRGGKSLRNIVKH